MANCDCERWERIYRERFEDPEYYTRPRDVRRLLQSSLAWAIKYAVPLDVFGPVLWDRGKPGAQMGAIVHGDAVAADARRNARG